MYQSTNPMFRSLTDGEEEEFRFWARSAKNQEEIRRRIKNGSVSILHPVVRDEFRKLTGEECP